jgi:hypothetical protein
VRPAPSTRIVVLNSVESASSTTVWMAVAFACACQPA